MSLVGKEINDFSTQVFQDSSLKVVNREDLRGKWGVFFFYPADFTFVCPTELEGLENDYAIFQKAGCEIYSVSCDTHFVYKAWRDRSEKISEITYPVLADPTQALTRDFEVLIPETDLVERGTFIMDPDLKIVAYEINTGNVGCSAEGLLHKVQVCQFAREHDGEVCPARWTLGVKILRPSLGLVGAL